MPNTQTTPPIAEILADRFAEIPQVIAVALAGSSMTGAADALSDIDIYVYITADIPVDIRAALVHTFTEQAEINNQFWETGDEWIDPKTGLGIDIIYRSPQWIADEIERVLVRHQASVGYSTCLWHNVLISKPLYDRDGWFGKLQERARQPYPEPLKHAILAKNYPLLRKVQLSFRHQIEIAALRHDLVNVNHRIAALFASYFDVLFAINHVPHPGEKRLVELAQTLCAHVPQHMAEQIAAVITATTSVQTLPSLIKQVDRLLDSLDELLLADEGLITNSDRSKLVIPGKTDCFAQPHQQ
ncbi:MAG: DUF4037 domain-containing protein [Tolypothrix carrinoi HA7290-LM1]|jgi:predicted nucleotidyltransferase|nr:DUF4037 domain-containing protein [Tolypothrix carrinoi HA7290-LM1]